MTDHCIKMYIARALPFPLGNSAISAPTLTWAAAGIFGLGIAYILSSLVYTLFFHPLSKFPGPRHAALTEWTYIFWFMRGESVQWIDRLHRKYGEVVRLGPNRLSYITPTAWKDIYGHKSASRKSNPKDSAFFGPSPNGHYPLVTEPSDIEHARQRKTFSHAFSDRALRQQEDPVHKYVDQLVGHIRDKISAIPDGTPAKLDAVKFYNFTTFDIMGDLTFGEPLGNLQGGQYSPWVQAVFGSFKSMMIQNLLGSYPIINSADRVSKRLTKDTLERPDIWGLLLRHTDKEGFLSRPVMDSKAMMFMTAGTETTATSLSGLTWFLVKNKEKFERLLQEIRSVPDKSQLTSDRLRNMPYSAACMEEGLRCYPPVPFGNMREVAPGGNTVCGDWLPEKTRLSLAQYTAYKSPLYLKSPELFVPERWMLHEPGYEDYHQFDRREVLLTFSTGPRNCIGKNLAYYEMRVILAKVLYNFNIKLCLESENWINQKNWLLWDKDPLMLYVTERR